MSDEIFDPETKNELPESLYELPRESRFKELLTNKKILYPSMAGLVLLLGFVAWAIFKPGNTDLGPYSNNVLLHIKGPTSINSGNEAEYKIIYINGEDADLTDVTLEMFYPANFKLKSSSAQSTTDSGQRFNLPLLKKGEEAEVKIKGKVSGSTGDIKEIRAKLFYKLSNFNSEFFVEAKTTTSVLAPNLTIEITGPIEVVGGQDTTFTINYSNVSSQSFENLAIIVGYPSGFKFSSATPSPSKNENYWSINKLDLEQTGKIEITGSFASNQGSDQLISAELGMVSNNSFAPLINSSTVFKVVPSSLSLTLKSNAKDYVELGQNLEFTLDYANYGNIGLTNLVISATLEGSVYDLTRITAQDAIINNNTITWKSAIMPSLSLVTPNQKGKVTFTVPIKTSLATNVKNQTVKASASIYASEVPKLIRVPDLELKLASQLGLQVSGEYVSGSLPMKVGESTTFAMTLFLSNLSNDLDNTEVIASLPLSASAWENVVIPESEKARLSYDPTSGKIRWKVGSLPAFTGKFSPVLKVTFHLRVTPTDSDRGKVIELLRETQAFGKDIFINKEISSVKVNKVDTGSIDDDLVNLRGTTVQ